jgi:hypothetical protein
MAILDQAALKFNEFAFEELYDLFEQHFAQSFADKNISEVHKADLSHDAAMRQIRIFYTLMNAAEFEDVADSVWAEYAESMQS